MFNVVENTEMLQGVCSVSIQSTVCGLVHLKKKSQFQTTWLEQHKHLG